MVRIVLRFTCLLATFLQACGGGSPSPTPPPPPPAVASHFSVVAPATSSSGVAFQITVTALSASNTTVTSYAGTVHFISSDPRAVLPADSVLVSGTATFAVTLFTASMQTVTATDTLTASITGVSNSLTIGAGQFGAVDSMTTARQ